MTKFLVKLTIYYTIISPYVVTVGVLWLGQFLHNGWLTALGIALLLPSTVAFTAGFTARRKTK